MVEEILGGPDGWLLGKPEELNMLEICKHGVVLNGVTKLKCDACREIKLLESERDSSKEAYEYMREELTKATGHIAKLNQERDSLREAIYKNLCDPYSSDALETLRAVMVKQMGEKWEETFNGA